MHIEKGGGQREINNRYDILLPTWLKYSSTGFNDKVKYYAKVFFMR